MLIELLNMHLRKDSFNLLLVSRMLFLIVNRHFLLPLVFLREDLPVRKYELVKGELILLLWLLALNVKSVFRTQSFIYAGTFRENS